MDKVTIIGLGYVGLPLSLVFLEAGFEVFGLDVREDYIERVSSGTVKMFEDRDGKSIQEILKNAMKTGRYHPTTDPDFALNYDNQQIILTVGIPLQDNRADPSMLNSALVTLGKRLKKGALVVARSTLIVGYTRNFIAPKLEKESGLSATKDFDLAFSSERMAEGAAFEELIGMTTPVAGLTPRATERSAGLLEKMGVKNVLRASCPEAVESAKVFENIARDVNIALANEYANFCTAYNLDTKEVLELVRTHKRVKFLHSPGPGVGGHCLPQAMYYLKPTADQIGTNLPVIETSRKVNSNQPIHIANLAMSWLKKNNIKKGKISILGLAMKDFSTDARWSPAVDIASFLQKNHDGELMVWDNNVDKSHIDFEFNFCDTIESAVKDSSVVIVGARQEPIGKGSKNSAEILSGMNSPALLIDTRFVFERKDVMDKGIDYMAL